MSPWAAIHQSTVDVDVDHDLEEERKAYVSLLAKQDCSRI